MVGTYQWRAILVGVDAPGLVVRRELHIILRHVLVAATTTLCYHRRDHVTIAKVNAEVLEGVRVTRRPGAATCQRTLCCYTGLSLKKLK